MQLLLTDPFCYSHLYSAICIVLYVRHDNRHIYRTASMRCSASHRPMCYTDGSY